MICDVHTHEFMLHSVNRTLDDFILNIKAITLFVLQSEKPVAGNSSNSNLVFTC